MCRSPVEQWVESGLAGAHPKRRAHEAGWDEIERNGVVVSKPGALNVVSVETSCPCDLRSLRQDELSLPGTTQPIDRSLVLDFHHGAGGEQLGAENPLNSSLGRNAGCGKPGRSRVGKRLRIQSRVEGPVHVRVAKAGIPESVSQSSCTRASFGKGLSIIASTVFRKTEDVRNLIKLIVIRIILIRKGDYCQHRITSADARSFHPWCGAAKCNLADSRRCPFRVPDSAPCPRFKNRNSTGQSEFRNTRRASRSDFASD